MRTLYKVLRFSAFCDTDATYIAGDLPKEAAEHMAAELNAAKGSDDVEYVVWSYQVR